MTTPFDFGEKAREIAAEFVHPPPHYQGLPAIIESALREAANEEALAWLAVCKNPNRAVMSDSRSHCISLAIAAETASLTAEIKTLQLRTVGLLVEALTRVEWSRECIRPGGVTLTHCPTCKQTEATGHQTTCGLAAALAHPPDFDVEAMRFSATPMTGSDLAVLLREMFEMGKVAAFGDRDALLAVADAARAVLTTVLLAHPSGGHPIYCAVCRLRRTITALAHPPEPTTAEQDTIAYRNRHPMWEYDKRSE